MATGYNGVWHAPKKVHTITAALAIEFVVIVIVGVIVTTIAAIIRSIQQKCICSP